ncbi:MAG TPA: DNA polymerase IV [Tissierellaceae bacterium]|nr:DNA polymerase IV [Tissierellaceae bacterium]
MKNKDLNILHIDMDAFYASVEERDNPSLKGKPVIVGGKSRHGIVTTANYEARKYGVHSAMPMFIARRKCPHACYVPSRMARYKEVSEEVFDILSKTTKVIERVSIDESYIDISHLETDPMGVAKNIKKDVLDNTGLTMSIGISYNKFLAKLGSDWNKPSGIKVISKEMVPDILLPLPIKEVHGIGPKTEKRLNNIGVYIVEDLMRLSEEFLIELLGKLGRELYLRIRGIDKRKIEVNRERKSLGTEITFSQHTKDKDILKEHLYSFAKEISVGLQRQGFYGRTVTLKVRYDNFKIITRSKTLMAAVNSQEIIYEIGESLLDEIKLKYKLRLIGLTVSNLSNFGMEQLSIFGD